MLNDTIEDDSALRRPGGITFVVVLAYLAFIFQILTGVLVIIGSDEVQRQLRSGMTENELLAAGIIMCVIGVIGILLTGALARGSDIVRVLFTIWIVFQIAAGLFATTGLDGFQRGAGVLPLVFGIVILYLLFNRSAQDFFGSAD